MKPELKKLLFQKLLYEGEESEKRINGGDRRKVYTFIFDDKRVGPPDRRMQVSDLLKQIQHKYHGKFE